MNNQIIFSNHSLKRSLLLLSFVFAFLNTIADPREHNNDKRTIDPAINKLLVLADNYAAVRNYQASDSVLNIAITKAELNGNDATTIQAYWKYFSRDVGQQLQSNKSLEFSNNLLAIAKNSDNNEWYYYGYTGLAKTLLQKKETNLALETARKANYYANLLDNDFLKIENYLLWGKCLEADNNKLDAFRNYLNALYLSEKNQSDLHIEKCYKHLSHFYLLIKNYERARTYKLKEINTYTLKDSAQLIYKYSDLARIFYYNNEESKAVKLTSDILKYGYRNNDRELINTIIARHRTYLIDKGDFDKLSQFYISQYPNELKLLEEKDTLAFNRTMALIAESQGDITKAKNYYNNVEMRLLHLAESNIRQSNIYKRHGQFLIRTNNVSGAITKMNVAFDFAQKANYLPYLVEITAYLDSLYRLQTNYAKAYNFSKLNKNYSEQQLNSARQDDLLQMEIDNEARQRKLKEEQDAAVTERRHNLQYMIIVISIIGIFIILLILGSFQVPRFIIKALGFFSFIFLFEFIILLLDHKIMEITHHEPWKMLALKIILISFLLPFHHWIEHKVIHYLIERRLINPSKFSLKKFFGRKPKVEMTEEVTSE